MFCNRCGTPLQLYFQLCPKCGRRIGDPVSAVAQSRLQSHLQILGILWMALGCLFLIPALFLVAFGQGMHFILRCQETLPVLLPLILWIGGATLVLLGAGGICVGLGLTQRRPWARTAAIIVGVLALFHPPFGTALGIYTLWVLLADEHGDEYRYLTGAS